MDINKEVFDNLDYGISIISSDFRIEWVNKFLRNKGFKTENIGGQKCYQVYNNRKTICKKCPSLKAFSKQRKIKHIERGKDGKRYEITAIPIIKDGKVHKIVEISKEIVKPNNKFGDLINAIPEGADIVDEHLNLLWMNDNFLKIFGKESIGKKCYEVYKDDKKQCLKCPLKKIIKIGESQKIISSGVAGGRIFEITHKGIMYQGEKAILEIFRDVTERKKIEKNYEQRFEKAPLPYQSLDAKGHIFDVNQAWLKELGYKDKKEVIGKWFGSFLTKEFSKLFPKRFKKFCMVGNVRGVEFDMARKNGEKIHVSFDGDIITDDKGIFLRTQCIFRNITNEKKAEEELKTSEEIYKKLFESSKDAMMTLAPPNWNFTSGNKAIVDIFNVKNLKEFISLKPWQLSPKYQPDGQLSSVKAKKMIIKAVKTGSNFFEWTHKRLNKEDFCATVLLTRVKLKDNMFLQATVRDITEQKKSKKELKESEEKFRLLYEKSNDGIITANIKTKKFIFANKKIKDLLGYTQEEITKLSTYDIHPKRDLNNILKVFKNQALKNGPVAENIPTLKKDGSIIYCDISSFPIKLDGENVLIGFFRDITKKNKAAEKLIESEKRFQDIALSSGDWIWETDKNGKYTLSTGYINEILGYESKEIIGTTIFDYMLKDEVKRVAKNFQKIVSQKKPIIDLENWNLSKDGKRICLLTNGVPIFDKNGNLKGYRGVDKDITENKIAEERLKESTKRYVTLSDNIKVGIVLHGPKTQVLLSNPKASEIIGLTQEQMQGKKAIDKSWKFVREDNCDLPLKEYPVNIVFRTKKQISDYIIGVKRSDRTYITWVNVNAIPVLDKKNNIEYVTISFIDITDKKKAEGQIIREKEKAERYLNTAKVMMVALDDKGIITMINKNGCDILGYKESDIMGKNWFDKFLPTRLRKQVKSLSKQIMSGKVKSADNYINPILTKKGDERIIDWYNVSLKNKEGKIIGTLSSGNDVTEKKQSEEKILQYMKGFEASPNSMMLVGFDNKKAKIINVNEAFTTYYGFDSKTVIGKNPNIIRLGDLPKEYYDNMWNKILDPKIGVWKDEIVNKTKSGNKIHVILSISTIFEDEKPKYFVAHHVDISKRKKAEMDLAKAYIDLKKVDQMKSTLLRDVSHEMKTPSTLISMAGQVLYDEANQETPELPKIREYAMMVKKNADRFAVQINSIIELSRLEAMSSIKRSKLHIKKIIDSISNIYKNKIKDDKIKLTVKTKKIHTLSGNSDLLQLLIKNIIHNAIKFTRNDIKVETKIDNGNLVITVKDNGEGIPKPLQKSIFEPFTKEETSSEGLGVGLAICKKVVDLHKGTIEFKSNKKGTVFIIKIPR